MTIAGNFALLNTREKKRVITVSSPTKLGVKDFLQLYQL
jgi:hypothetical protein